MSDSNDGRRVYLKGQLPPSQTTPTLFLVGVLFGSLLVFLDVDGWLAAVLGGSRRGEQTGTALFLLFLVAAGMVNGYCAGLVAYTRSELKIPLPYYYPTERDIEGVSAADRHIWLSTVRVHDNLLEFLPNMLAVTAASTFVAGFRVLAPVLGLIWCVGRFFYALGYSTGLPQRRLPGLLLSLIPYFSQHGLILLYAVRLLLAK